ncbi:MAG: Phosphate regulon transcriptional regulatory protein PhoB [bacterium ADurb.Bin243]|nr:MAG: Phosphate regulon transcriptional regulatory protein PhoB [bacterium ADurb.Bin243]
MIMKAEKHKILIIEDDKILTDLLKDSVFKADEFEFTVIHSFNEAVARAGEIKSAPGLFDLIVLDLKLPGGSGLDILKDLRSHGCEIPVIILSSKNAENDRISGLELGADDYLCKPFSLKELYIRVKKIIERHGRAHAKPAPEQKHSFNGLSVDIALREVYVKDKRVNLTPNEFDILKFLIENKNAVITREMLISCIWGGIFIAGGTIDSYVSRLRNKISPCGDFIETVHGIGYKFKAV